MKKDREIMHNDKKDSELIAEYYDKYEQKLYRLSYAVLGDIWQAEEAVQETFLKVIRYRNMIKRMPEEKRSAYITKIARNIAVDMYRKNKRDKEAVCSLQGDDDSTELADNILWSHADPSVKSNMADEVENRQLITGILGRLSDDDALVLKLRIVRQLSVRETADLMRLTEAAVRKKYERAVKRARKLLMKEMMLDGE